MSLWSSLAGEIKICTHWDKEGSKHDAQTFQHSAASCGTNARISDADRGAKFKFTPPQMGGQLVEFSLCSQQFNFPRVAIRVSSKPAILAEASGVAPPGWSKTMIHRPREI